MNRTLFNVKLEETTKGRHYWVQSKVIPEEARSVARSADVLITPWEDRSQSGPSFPDGTTQFYQFLRQHLKGQSVAILSDQENYVELALHADTLRIPNIFVNKFALPVIVGVVLLFIDSHLDGKTVKPIVEFEIVVEGEYNECISVRYEGPPDRLADTLISEVERCLPSRQVSPEAEISKKETDDNKK